MKTRQQITNLKREQRAVAQELAAASLAGDRDGAAYWSAQFDAIRQQIKALAA